MFPKFPLYICPRLDIKENILLTSLHLFKTIGIKSVSMDDLARELSISKKTIYQHYKDKRALVNAVFEYDLELDKRTCTEAVQQTENAIQQFLNISTFVNNNLKEMNPSVLFDLRKYYPECWKQFNGFTKDVIHNFVINNLELGIEQGFYRKEIRKELIAHIYIALVRELVLPNLRRPSDLSLAEFHKEAIMYHLHAITTPKGKEYLSQHLIP